jgi:hypothetical protein
MRFCSEPDEVLIRLMSFLSLRLICKRSGKVFTIFWSQFFNLMVTLLMQIRA